ncbi:MAG: SMP-30/gluconolactonase/LRE family protein [Actinomycetales bacterium]
MTGRTSRSLSAALTVAGVVAATVVAGSGPASADSGHVTHSARQAHHTVTYTLDDSSHGNPEGVAWDGRHFFVGATGDGTIYRGTLGDRTVHTFIPGAAGRASVGMKTFHGRLYVAGGPTGNIYVYDVAHPRRAPITLATGAGGFLNDLVVTARGDVYVTDSFRPTLWHVPAGQVKPGGTVDGIDVSAEIPYTAGAFNLNGIVKFRGGRELVVVNTADGKLYRIQFHVVGGPTISVVDAPALVGGDGMIVDRGQLVVVRGDPASLTFLDLNDGRSQASIDRVVTDPALRGPSTVAAAFSRYLVVNADFATSTQPFTVAGLVR